MDLLKLKNSNQELLKLNSNFLKVCGLLPCDYKIINIINRLSIYFLALFLVTLIFNFVILTLDNETKNLNAILTNMKFELLTLINLFKYFTFIFRRNEWNNLLDYVNKTQLQEEVQNDLERRNIIRHYTKYSKVLTCIYGVFIFVTSSSVASTSILKYICTPTYIDGVRQFEQVVDVWAPFNIHVYPWCFLIFFWQCFVGLQESILLAAFDSASWVIMNFIEQKMKLIQLSCMRIYNSNEELSDEEFLKRVKYCHSQHNLCVKNATLLNTLISPVMFIYVLVCSLFLCTSAFQLSMDMSRAEKIINFIFLSSATIQLYVYCLHGNDVYNQSLEVSYGPYCCDWWLLDVRRRRMVLLLSGKLRKTVVFTAGPFTDLKMSTFIGIVKGAYSYYTLLRD